MKSNGLSFPDNFFKILGLERMNPQPKKTTKKDKIDKKYREWIRTQPCVGPSCKHAQCDIVAAHMRELGNGGTGSKPPDSDLLPLCFYCHYDHDDGIGAFRFWRKETKQEMIDFVQGLCNEHLENYKNFRRML